MKKHSILVLSLLTAMGATACSDSDGGTGGTAGSGGLAGSGTAGSSGMHSVAGSSGSPNGGSGHAGSGGTAGGGGTTSGGNAGSAGATAGSGGTTSGGTDSGGTAGSGGTTSGGTDSGGTAGSGGTCDIPTLQVFPRSDTTATWDDNDFSDATFTGSCPTLVSVTWPHEAGWENGDPAEANHESTHFTIDSYSSVDLTNKELRLSIELSGDHRGPNATAGSYIVSLVSVSTYDNVIVTGGGGSGGDGSGGTTTTTETGYSEAESPVGSRATLSQVGDKATLAFALPNKTDVVSSYDPTRVIKINVRIYSAFSNGSTAGGTGGAGGGGMAGIGGGGASGTAGVGGTAGSDAGGTGGTTAGSGGTAAGAGGTAGMAGTGGATAAPVYDYLTSEFSITNFAIKDVGAP